MAPATVVHTSPPLAPLPASDVRSMALLATVRAGGVNPGVTTADWGANGKPFVTYEGNAVVDLSSLPSYRSPDGDLRTSQRSDALTWAAYIDGTVTDLIYHSLYSLPPNYPYLAGAQLAALPFPMNHYVPQRLRSIHRTRLNSVGLWGVGGLNPGDTADEDRKALEDSIVVAPGGTKAPRAWSGWNAGREQAERLRKFGEETIRKRARGVFEPLARKLGDNKLFFGQRPTSLDIALFSNLTLVLSPSLPNHLLADFLRAEFPTLVAHHDLVRSSLWPKGWDSIERVAPPSQPSLFSRLKTYMYGKMGSTDAEASDDLEDQLKAQEERSLSYGRYLWIGGAVVALVGYVFASGLLRIEFGEEDGIWIEEEEGLDELDDEDGEGDEDEDEDEEEDDGLDSLLLDPEFVSHSGKDIPSELVADE